jgi:hypothetical protein
MKRFNFLFLLSFLLMGAGALSQADEVRLQVKMIAADQRGGDSDESLRAILPNLQTFPYKRFQEVGSRTVSLGLNKKQLVNLGDGNEVVLQMTQLNGNEARVDVNWRKDGKKVADITVVSRPGSPFVLGGPSSGGSTYIAVFTRKDR